MAGQGKVVESEDTIILEDVPIITPNNDIVVPSLSFEVRDNAENLYNAARNNEKELDTIYAWI